MRMLKGIIVLVLILTLVSPVLSEADTKYEYSDWSPWQTESISSSETLEVETRTADITETKTEYSYEYWRYWNSSSGTYLYKGNASRGGTYYSVTLPSRLKYYSNTSDGASYIVGGGKYINFKGECWFNEKEVKTSVVTGKKTEYRYRERTKVDISDMEVTIPITENSDETPGIIRDLESSKSEYAESDNIIISWSSAKNAFEYGLTVRKSPYTGEQSIVYDGRISGNSVNIGTLEPGSYRFAMRAYSSSGDKGPISKIIYFTVVEAEAGIELSNPIFPIDVKDTAIGDNVGIVDVKSLTAVTYGGKVSYYKNGGEDYTGGHYGTDYRAVDISFSGCEGKAVYAVENGTVVNVKSDDGLVHIKHVIPLVLYDGSHSYKEWFTTYAHMKDIKVKTGITVKKGDIIGYISNTNYLKDPKMAKHLHFAVTTRLYEGKASYHYAYPYAKDKVKLKEYSNATISPYWLGGSYRNVNYKAYTSDIADNSAVKRITCDTSVAPASTFGK